MEYITFALLAHHIYVIPRAVDAVLSAWQPDLPRTIDLYYQWYYAPNLSTPFQAYSSETTRSKQGGIFPCYFCNPLFQ